MQADPDLQSIFEQGRSMFLGPIYGPNGVEDKGSKHLRGAPVMCTEFGGINIAKANDESRKGNWGYTTATDAQDLLKRIEHQLVGTVGEGHCCGIVWTQFTDIEQEQNGLYSYNRQEKLPAAEMRKLMERAKQMYFAKRRSA